MAWEQRGTQRYYYRSRRKHGRVIREYCGRGVLAERAVAEDTARQAGRNTGRIVQAGQSTDCYPILFFQRRTLCPGRYMDHNDITTASNDLLMDGLPRR